MIHGWLLCNATATTIGQSVTVYERRAGTRGFSLAGTTVTEAGGSFEFAPAALDANSLFYVRSVGARSAHVWVRVVPQVTLRGSPPDGAQLFIGGHRHRGPGSSVVTFTGAVAPAGAGAIVALQCEDDLTGEWHRIGLGEVGSDGTYSITHTFGVPGEVHVRVVVHQQGHLAGTSEALDYVITQRQNPRLTVHAAANRISFGQAVTFSGVLADGAGRPVTLLARTGDGSFAPVAKAASDSGGGYVFPVQRPSQSTSYMVTGAGARSTVLHEIVRYTLTALPSPATVSAGQTLTFSGTVTPVHAGHPVYLERQDASRVGFHVVGTGSVAADSSYSILHTFSGAGASTLRIRVPGDSQNGEESSAPFTVTLEPQPPVSGWPGT
jgi:hypothetical protein